MHRHSSPSRRAFLTTAAAVAGSAFIPYTFTAHADEKPRPRSKNDRFRVGAIGLRYQGTVIALYLRADGHEPYLGPGKRDPRQNLWVKLKRYGSY